MLKISYFISYVTNYQSEHLEVLLISVCLTEAVMSLKQILNISSECDMSLFSNCKGNSMLDRTWINIPVQEWAKVILSLLSPTQLPVGFRRNSIFFSNPPNYLLLLCYFSFRQLKSALHSKEENMWLQIYTYLAIGTLPILLNSKSQILYFKTLFDKIIYR